MATLTRATAVDVLIEWREGATLRGRRTDWGEARRGGGYGPEACVSADTPAGRLVFTVPDRPISPHAINLPDGRWLGDADWSDFVAVVEAVLGGKALDQVYADWA